MVKQKKAKEELIAPVKANEQKSKPTPEQMRIAQILDKKVIDSTVKLKLKQIMDATQRPADEVYVALHDSDFDENRAVDLLIEGDSLANWCTLEKKKKKLQELKEKKTEEGRHEQNEEVLKVGKAPFRVRENGGRPSRGRNTNGSERRPWRGNNEEFKGRGQDFKGRGYQPKGISGTMVFERSTTQENNADRCIRNSSASVKNQWDKPLLRTGEDDWDTEEFTGSLSQTQIFTSSVKGESDIIPEDCQNTPNLPEGANSSWSPPPQASPLPPTIPLQPCIRPDTAFAAMVPCEASQTEVCPNVSSSHMSPPSDKRSDYLCHISNYGTKPLHVPPSSDRKLPPSKIPSSAVEMPPEMKSSLSFLDIQFGAIELGPSASEDSSTESNSNGLSQNASSTTLLAPSSLTSSGSLPLLMGNTISGCTSGNLSNPSCASLPTVTGIGQLAPPVISSPSTVNHLVPSVSPLNHLITPSTLAGTGNVMMAHHTLTAPSSHHVGHNNLHSGSSATTQNRFISSSQSFNSSHLPYSFMTPPSSASTHQMEPRAPHETNTSIPPPHLIQPSHLPPFKQTPPGVPKGAIVANLPHGSLVGNQYIVGQGNVPYFPPHPIYYYEEVPPVMNNQQRMPHRLPTGYEVSYPPSNPSSRDGVHYNV